MENVQPSKSSPAKPLLVILLMGLTLVFVIIGIKATLKKDSSNNAKEPLTHITPSKIAPTKNDEVSLTQDVKTSFVKVPSLKIKGIIYDTKNPLVVINDDFYYEGDVIKDMTILTIGETWVELEYQGKSFRLEVAIFPSQKRSGQASL